MLRLDAPGIRPQSLIPPFRSPCCRPSGRLHPLEWGWAPEIRGQRPALLETEGAGHLAKLEPRQSREIGFYEAVRAPPQSSPSAGTAQSQQNRQARQGAKSAKGLGSWPPSIRGTSTATNASGRAGGGRRVGRHPEKSLATLALLAILGHRFGASRGLHSRTGVAVVPPECVWRLCRQPAKTRGLTWTCKTSFQPAIVLGSK